ncbi:uncharacterized protein TrAFT101_001998 [Trichoderma asperellum]|uniref:uncharacterized protein n=1 Tax=Trichoderma asperellum TaxID=101201 RepID=UPI00332798BA|nr:hypothetical protein TrAFT101_001998 [Trichoderma asperellum]
MWGRAHVQKPVTGDPVLLASRLPDPYTIPTAPCMYYGSTGLRDRRRSPSRTGTGGERSREAASEWPILHIRKNAIDKLEMLILYTHQHVGYLW